MLLLFFGGTAEDVPVFGGGGRLGGVLFCRPTLAGRIHVSPAID